MSEEDLTMYVMFINVSISVILINSFISVKCPFKGRTIISHAQIFDTLRLLWPSITRRNSCQIVWQKVIFFLYKLIVFWWIKIITKQWQRCAFLHLADFHNASHSPTWCEPPDCASSATLHEQTPTEVHCHAVQAAMQKPPSSWKRPKEMASHRGHSNAPAGVVYEERRERFSPNFWPFSDPLYLCICVSKTTPARSAVFRISVDSLVCCVKCE